MAGSRGRVIARALLACATVAIGFTGGVLAIGVLIAAAAPAQATEAAVGPAFPPRALGAQSAQGYGPLIGHGGPVKAITLSRNGRIAASGSFDYALIVWGLEGSAGRPLHRLTHQAGAVNAVAFIEAQTSASDSGPSALLSAGDDGRVMVTLLEAPTSAPLVLGSHKAKVVHLAISADATFAASASWDRTARLWDLKTRQPRAELTGHGGPVNAVAFGQGASAGTVFTASADGMVRQFDAQTGDFKRQILAHGWGVNVLASLPEGGLVYGAIDGTTRLIDPSTSEERKVLLPHGGPVLALGLSADGRHLATGGGDGAVRLYDTTTWTLLDDSQAVSGPVWALAIADNASHVFHGGLDDRIATWQVSPPGPPEPPAEDSVIRRFQVPVATADDPLALGQSQFARKCSVCHTLTPDDANRAGPTLYGIIGRRAGTLAGYPFSPALSGLDLVWTEATLAQLFDEGPDKVTPGSKMPVQRITDPAKLAALVAYLKTATTVRAP